MPQYFSLARAAATMNTSRPHQAVTTDCLILTILFVRGCCRVLIYWLDMQPWIYKGWFIIWGKDLRCVAFRPEVHTKWFGRRRNVEIEKNSIPALRRRPLKSFYMHFRLKRNAAQILASYYKPTLMVACTRYLYTPAEAIMQVKIWTPAVCTFKII